MNMLLLPIAYSNQHTGCENIHIYHVEVVISIYNQILVTNL